MQSESGTARISTRVGGWAIHRVGPLLVIAFGLILTAGWTAFLGYVLFSLILRLF
jgi:hypothetical protein